MNWLFQRRKKCTGNVSARAEKQLFCGDAGVAQQRSPFSPSVAPRTTDHFVVSQNSIRIKNWLCPTFFYLHYARIICRGTVQCSAYVFALEIGKTTHKMLLNVPVQSIKNSQAGIGSVNRLLVFFSLMLFVSRTQNKAWHVPTLHTWHAISCLLVYPTLGAAWLDLLLYEWVIGCSVYMRGGISIARVFMKW